MKQIEEKHKMWKNQYADYQDISVIWRKNQPIVQISEILTNKKNAFFVWINGTDSIPWQRMCDNRIAKLS